MTRPRSPIQTDRQPLRPSRRNHPRRANPPRAGSLLLAAVGLAVLAPHTAAAYTVRADRPRIWLSNGTGFGTSLATFRQRCASDPAYGECSFALNSPDNSTYPAAANAARYLLDGDATHCAAALAQILNDSADAPGTPDAHGFVSNHGGRMADMAAGFDWCFAGMNDTQRAQAAAQIKAYGDWYLANGEVDIFGDDENNIWASLALAGLALAGSANDADAQRYLAAADTHWKTVIFPALAYNGDWWHEGMTYVQPAIRSLAPYAAAWSTATDDNVYAYGQSHGDVFEGYLRMHAYALRPDDHYVYFGDTSDNKQSIELFSRPLVDLLTYGTASPLGQALSMYIHAHAQRRYDYGGADGWMPAIFYDAAREASTPDLSTQPTARWLSRGAQDVAVMRSGWGPNDTYVYVMCGDMMASGHQHAESGSFQVFRHTMLSGSTGYYDSFDTSHWDNYYSQHSVHANTLAVVQPGEFFPTLLSLGDPTANVNDGGERVVRMDRAGTHYQSHSLSEYQSRLRSGPSYEFGDMRAFSHGSCYDYVACDVTAAYTSPGFATNGNTPKVNEVSRQFVFIPPETLVVFDRVESTDASYEKRFLLQGVTAPVAGAGNTFTITNGGGVLTGRTLLPSNATASVVNGFTVDGRSFPPSQAGVESGGSRLEVSPSNEGTRDYFLHVLRATDPSDPAPPQATVTEAAGTATLSVTTPQGSYTVTLAKTGALGGHLAFRPSSGGAGCDEDLGGGASTADAGAGDSGTSDAGGARADANGMTGGDAGDAGDGGTTSRSAGGCGCRAPAGNPGERDGGATVLAAAALAAASARRRRATKA